MASIKAESIKVFGFVRIPGAKDQALKVELKRYNGTVGLDIRAWYKKAEDKLTDSDRASMDAKGYNPGKGIFLRPDIAEYVIKKLHSVGTDDAFLAAVKAAKEGAAEAKHTDAAAAKLQKENEDLKARLAKLEAMMTAAAATPAHTEAAAAAEVEELAEVELPESSTTSPSRSRRSTRK